MSAASSDAKCSALGCLNTALSRCTKCRDATPPTVYCSSECQRKDWKYHKKYCGKFAYTFEMRLLGSSDPVIKRTFDVPSWYTFQELHYTLQYAMGPWECTHLHEFSFFNQPEGPIKGVYYSSSKEILKVRPSHLYEDNDFSYDFPGFPADRRNLAEEGEERLLLSDVFDPRGRLYNNVAPNGQVLPLVYTYDLGDNWEHELIFKGRKLAREARPVFTLAEGCAPIEDSGSIDGWNQVKAAFHTPAAQRNSEQRFRIKWAKEVSGLGEACDPFKEPDLVQMNYEGRWENHFEAFKRMRDDEPDDYGP